MHSHDEASARPMVDALEITDSVLKEIMMTIGLRAAESGGILGGAERQGLVSSYYFDSTGQCTPVQYTTDHVTLNRLLRDDWNPNGVRFRGFVHSHPYGLDALSGRDLGYAERILAENPELECLWLPIVTSESGQFAIHPYAAVRANGAVEIKKVPLVIVSQRERTTGDTAPIPHSCLNQPLDKLVLPLEASGEQYQQAERDEETFSRVRSAYDHKLMRRTRLFVVGLGGAAAFVEDMSRAGIGEIIPIDPETIEESNLATQQAYRSDIGRPKVDCIAERVLDINPNILVKTFHSPLDDITDEQFSELAHGELAGRKAERVVLCGMTDDFYAQARVHRLALNLGVPSLCAQVYQEGRGAEITFTHPDVTEACHRCVLDSRYRAFLQEGYRNTVTSHGTPIFSTTRLNALKGFITLALIHHGTDHPRWGGLLKRIGVRNLVQIRLDPDIGESMGLTAFDSVLAGADTERILFDETIWLPRHPVAPFHGAPACPDCGGTGNLRDAIGTFEDTRVMRT